MQHAGKLLDITKLKTGTGFQTITKPISPSTTSMPSNTTKPVSRRIERLFTRFAAIYGHLWRSQFKSEEFISFAKREWEEGLRGFSDEILNLAINEARDFLEMPPTLAQLIGSCRQIRRRYTFNVRTTQKTPDSSIVRAQEMATCRKLLSNSMRK